MKRNKYNWEAFTGKNRMSIIEQIKDIINKHGFILNANMFSDLALSISAEIEESEIPLLHSDLKQIVTLNEVQKPELKTTSKKEAFVYLNILFGKGTGDLTHTKPKVDG